MSPQVILFMSITCDQQKSKILMYQNKPFFDKPVKNKQETYEKRIEMSRNGDYRTGDLSGYFYHEKYYKLTDIDLSRQTNSSIPQQISRKIRKR